MVIYIFSEFLFLSDNQMMFSSKPKIKVLEDTIGFDSQCCLHVRTDTDNILKTQQYFIIYGFSFFNYVDYYVFMIDPF